MNYHQILTLTCCNAHITQTQTFISIHNLAILMLENSVDDIK